MLSHRIRKTAVAAAVVASVVGSGVMSVAAQDTTATPNPPSTDQATTQALPGRGFARGMMMGGGLLDIGPSGDLTDSPIITAIADALKLDAQTLVDDLQSGKSITDLADEQSVDIQTVYDAVIAKFKERLDAEVSAGYLTQAQADERLQTLTDNIAQFPLFAAVRFPNPGDQQGFLQNGPMGRGPRGGFPGGNGPWGNQQGGPGSGPWGNQQGGMNGHHGPWGNQQSGMNGNGPQGNQQPPAPPSSDSAPDATPAGSASA